MRFVTSILLFLSLFSSSAQQSADAFLFSYFKGNGEDGLHLAVSYDGLKWTALNDDKSFLKPAVGSDKLMRDPCIISGPDGIFRMVWTVSWGERGIGYASSDDLMHWSAQKFIPVMAHEPAARNCWAPEVFYDENSEQYIIYWATTIPGRFPETEKKGDDNYNHRLYYVTTKDFNTFSKTKLLYDKGFNVIDGTLMNESGKYYLFLKDETRHPAEKNIRIATSPELTKNFGNPTEPITGNYWAEGPTVLKMGEYRIVYFDKYRKQKMGAVRSKDLQNWEDISGQVDFPQGARHGTVFKVKKEVVEKLKNN